MSRRHRDHNELPIFKHMLDFTQWLLTVSDQFPKKARFTLSNRLINLCLDVSEDLVEARYSKDKAAILKRANLRLEKMRVLFRIAYQARYLSPGSFNYGAESMDVIGAMLGGWRKQATQR